MKILEVLDRVNTYLLHNQYGTEELINWCDELGARICREVKKQYGYMEIPPHNGEGFLLPEYLEFEDVESVRTPDGRSVDKTDMRSFDVFSKRRTFLPAGSIVVYLMRYQPIRNVLWRGTAEQTEEGIIITDPPFVAGDILTIELGGERLENVNLLGVVLNEGGFDKYTLILDRKVTGGEGSISRLLTEETEVPPPYDSMYISYLLAQMGLHQNDYDRYNAQMSAFNELYKSYSLWYAERAPVNKRARIINYW